MGSNGRTSLWIRTAKSLALRQTSSFSKPETLIALTFTKPNIEDLISNSYLRISLLLKLLQKPEVITPEVTNIVNLIAQHELAFGSHAPGETGIAFGVIPAILQHNGMHHTAAEDLQPAR